MRNINFIILSLLFSLYYSGSTFAQINKSNGYATQSIPLFNIKDEKGGLDLNISLHYSSGGGVQANEPASALGLKWALDVGGVIERETRGIPDDQFCSYPLNMSAEYQIVRRDIEEAYNNYYPNGYLYTSVLPDDRPKELAIQPRFRESQTADYKQSARSSADREADIFRFSMNGRSGSFIIGKNKVPISLDCSELKISFEEQDMYPTQQIRTKIKSFTITDENGVVYTFNAIGKTKISKPNSTNQEYTSNTSINHTSNNPTNEFIINEWHLGSISNTLTGATINFEYDEIYSENSTAYEPAAHVSVSNDANSLYRVEYTTMSCTYSKSFQYKRQINRIVLPDNRSIQFTYFQNIYREDVPSERPIQKIEYRYMDKTVQFAAFSYKYFYKKQLLPLDNLVIEPNDKRYLRLALVGIRSGGANNETLPETKFEYYTGDDDPDAMAIVPPRYTFSSDNWGYYNAAPQIKETGGLEDFSYYDTNKWQLTNFLIAKMDKENPYILSDGSLSANAEILKLKDIKPGYAKFGLLRKIKYEFGGSLEYYYEQNKSLNDVVGGVRVNKIILDDGEGRKTATNYKYGYRNCVDCSEPAESGWGYEAPKFSQLLNSIHNTTSDGIIESFKKSGKENVDLNSYERSKFLHTAVQANSYLQTGAQFMGYHSFGDFLQSSLESRKWSFKLDYNGIINFILQSLLHNIIGKKSIACSYTPMNYRNSFGINYSSVTEWLNNGENGYKTEVLTGWRDITFPNWQTVIYQYPYSARQRFYSWEVGLPKSTEYYDKNWNLKKLEEYKYNFKVKQLDNNYRSVAWGVTGYYSHRHDWYAYNTANVPDKMLAGDGYVYKVGKSFLSETRTTMYGEDNNIAVQTSRYEYNQYNNQLSAAYTTDSKGNISGSNSYYISDYNIPGIMQLMKARNMINIPVSTISWFQKTGEPKKMISTSITEFRSIANGDIKPLINYGNRVKNMPVVNLANNFDATNLVNYPDIESRVTNIYDVNGNLVQVIEKDRNPQSFIYNYNNRFEVAKIENAESGKTAFTSFETPEQTNWNLNRCATTNAYSITGNWCLRLTNTGSVTTTIAIGEPYLLSFWMRGNNVTINNGAILPKIQAPVINGWTYMQYEIPANASPVSITGNCYLDELRLYSKKSSMVTTTYDPAFGHKTSECDVNNRITYFQYDNMGRLVAERDERYDVIKYYEYKFKNQ
jgi:hypothetical protein